MARHVTAGQRSEGGPGSIGRVFSRRSADRGRDLGEALSVGRLSLEVSRRLGGKRGGLAPGTPDWQLHANGPGFDVRRGPTCAKSNRFMNYPG